MTNVLIDTLLEIGRITPFSGNMFDVAVFGRDQNNPDDALAFPDVWLRCSSLTLDSPTELRFIERHPLTKEQLIEGVQFSDSITITWLEDQFLSVWNYHRTWLSYFYDRERDQFRSGVRGKKRRAEIILQEMRSPQTVYTHNTRDGAEDRAIQHFLLLDGLMPVKTPEVALGWDRDAAQQLSIQYRVDTISYQIRDPRTGVDPRVFRSHPNGVAPNVDTPAEV